MTTKTGSGAEGGSRPPPKDKPKPQGKRCACCGKSKARLYGGVCKPCLFGWRKLQATQGGLAWARLGMAGK
jgi:hypothetical protein